MKPGTTFARYLFPIVALAMCSAWLSSAVNFEILTAPSSASSCVAIAGSSAAGDCAIVVATNDFDVVQLTAGFFADDIQRVTGKRPAVTNVAMSAKHMIVAGTLGRSALIDELVAGGKLQDVDRIRGRWEATLWQVVANPYPGVERALVIVGSDRRGTAYGLMELSGAIGVSPWYWWADVPTKHFEQLAINIPTPMVDAPAVKYRGIFINDEDWGLFPWAKNTFEPEFGNIGPKTYTKVFELMLRLRLNYLWPAMHSCSREFGATPENVILADKLGIVAGSSHCEPMLCNNIHWNEKEQGRWNYSLNRDTIHSYWEKNAKARGDKEAVWTLGIRGIHDAAMQKPPNELAGRIKLVDEVIHDQRALLEQNLTKEFGPVAQCFVPYKEVLPIYDAGLKVPDDVTLVWVDDNFGYIRRLSSPAERKRQGGAGVYWHLSYYGNPHSYTWINTTPPALIWEELHKAWENDARNLWVINVGDIKPMEIGIDYFSRLAWNPESHGPDTQPRFLRAFVTEIFGKNFAEPAADLLGEFYRLGTVRKPELMNRAWAVLLPEERAEELCRDYVNLLQREEKIANMIPAETRDAWTEMVGFPARVLGNAGLIFMADRDIQFGKDVATNESAVVRLRAEIESQVEQFNTHLAGGKWKFMMSGLVTGKDLTRWSSQVRWPWGEQFTNSAARPSRSGRVWRDAASADRQTTQGWAGWREVAGLGTSGKAMMLKPASLQSSWKEGDAGVPGLEFNFSTKAGDAEAFIDFLPTFRIVPGMKQRVAVSVDAQSPLLVEVPGSSGAEDENGKVRADAVQNNYTRAGIPLPQLTAGKHTFSIRAVDPGVVIDRVSLP